MDKNKKAASDQSQRFIDAAREAGCSEDEAVFDENLKKIGRQKAAKVPAPKPERERQSK